MELRATREPTSCAATRQFPSILWNPKLHYRSHKSSPLVPVLSQTTPVHTTPFYLSKFILILSSHLHLGLLSGSFPLVLPPITYLRFSSPHSCYMHCQSHPPCIDYSDYTWRRVQITTLLIMQFLHPLIISSLFGPKILLSTLFTNTFSPCSFLNVRD
jgi:hypothetical protein